MLAKSLKRVDHPEKIVTEAQSEVRKYGATACSKRTQSMDTSRKEARTLPRVNRPRKKVRDVEGETATCVKASIALTVKVRSMGFHRGMSLWRVPRETYLNLGDLSASPKGVVVVNELKAPRRVLRGRSQICYSTPRR
jgi:hypothetical protein